MIAQILMLFILLVRDNVPPVAAASETTVSRWSSYVASLPPQQSHSAEHTAAVACVLSGTEAGRALQSKARSLEREWAGVAAPCWQCLVGDSAALSLDAWRWADGVFWSRVFSLHDAVACEADALGADADVLLDGPDRVLIPAVDFANHSSVRANARWQLCAGSCDAASQPFVALVAEAGSTPTEVLLNYGEKPNSELVFHYGFCDEESTSDFAGLPLLFSDDATVCSAQQSLLQSYGLRSPVLRVRPADAASLTGGGGCGGRELLRHVLVGDADVVALRVCACVSVAEMDAVVDSVLASSRAVVDGVSRSLDGTAAGCGDAGSAVDAVGDSDRLDDMPADAREVQRLLACLRAHVAAAQRAVDDAVDEHALASATTVLGDYHAAVTYRRLQRGMLQRLAAQLDAACGDVA